VDNSYKEVAGGRERIYNCPFCEAKGKSKDIKGHLYYNPQKGLFYCHRCGTKGDKEKLSYYLKLGPSEFMGDFDKVVFEFKYGKLPEEEQPRICPYPDAYEIIPGSVEEEYLIKRGISRQHMKKYGLLSGYRDLSDRIVIPVYYNGDLVYWQARAIKKWVRPRYIGPELSKEDVIFNRDTALGFKRAIILEGALNVIIGGKDCLALLGKDITRDQLEVLIASDVEEFICCLDDDAIDKSIEIAKSLKERKETLRVKVMIMPVGRDAVDVGFTVFRQFVKDRTYEFDEFFGEHKIKMFAISLNGRHPQRRTE